MVKNIKNSGSGSSKNIRNDDSLKLSSLKVVEATITNATITNLTNSELQTATANISTNASNIATNTASISTNASNIATNTASISTNASNIATNTASISTNTASISTNASNITNLENNKQDLITDDTNLEINRLDINESIRFQFNDSTDEKTKIERGDANGKLKLTGNNVFFHDDTDAETFAIKNNGDLNCFNNSIDNVLDIDLNGSSLNFQLLNKQDTLTAGNGITISAGLGTSISVNESELTTKQDLITTTTALSCASVNLNSGDITNGGTGNFSSINLSGSDLQGKIDDKADLFGILLPLELDSLAIPNPALKLNYNSDEFELENGTDLKLSGNLPTLTSGLNLGTNTLSGVTSLSCRSIELHNSTSGSSFLDFGGGDFRLRQIYKQTENTFTFLIDDETGENPEDKLQITRTEVNILNASLNLNDQDITGLKFIQGDSSIKFYIDGDTTGGTDFTLDLKADGDADFNGGSLLNVEEVENAVKFVEFGAPPNSATNNLWGGDNIHDSFIENLNINASGMVSHSSGVFTINEAGTYTISLNSSIEDVDFNGRLVCGQYLSVNNDSSKFRSTPGAFALTYIRDDGFGFAGSLSFSFTLVLSVNDNIRFKTKIGKNTDNRAYDDTHSETGLNWWCGVRFEKYLIA